MANKQLDKETLNKMLFSASLMSAIDGHFDKTERGICTDFLLKNWRTEFGDAKEFFTEILNNVRSLLKSGHEMYDKINEITSELALNLTESQKEALINLVETVMMADGKILLREADLLNRFRKKLEDPNLINLTDII